MNDLLFMAYKQVSLYVTSCQDWRAMATSYRNTYVGTRPKTQ